MLNHCVFGIVPKRKVMYYYLVNGMGVMMTHEIDHLRPTTILDRNWFL